MAEQTRTSDKVGVSMAVDIFGEFADVWLRSDPDNPIRLDLPQIIAMRDLMQTAYLWISSRYPDINDDAYNPDMAGDE